MLRSSGFEDQSHAQEFTPSMAAERKPAGLIPREITKKGFSLSKSLFYMPKIGRKEREACAGM
jgi:hypothetical protein